MLDNAKILELRVKIQKSFPQDFLQLKPNVPGHIYVNPESGAEYVSTTTRNNVIHNPIFQNWRMNRLAEFIADHKDEITRDNIDEFIKKGKEYVEEVFKKSGALGTLIHDYANQYFTKWIKENKQPASILTLIDGSTGPKEPDYKVWSALRSLETWVNKNQYIPLASELKVWGTVKYYRIVYNMAGTIDNIGIDGSGKVGAPDWKTSNDFRDDYWIQLGNYSGIFTQGTGIRLHWGKIVKLDKEKGEPDEEIIDDLKKRFRTSLVVAELYNDIQEIRHLRKPDNKVKI